MRSIALALFVSLSAASAVHADPVKLRLGSTIAAPAVQNKLMFDPWIAKVNKESGGALEITNTYGNLANPMTAYDAVTSGSLDIAWVLHGFTPGRFPKSSVVQVPFESLTAVEATTAIWNLYEKGLIASEYKNVKVFAIHAFTQAVYHSKKAVTRMEDIKGVKTRISSRMLADMVTALGGVPVSLPSPTAYQFLANGVVDADFVQWTIVCVARINEIAKHHLEGPLGGQGAMFIMNLRKWKSLPKKAQETLEANSGRALSIQFGAVQDQIHTGCRDATSKMPGQHIVQISDAELARWEKAVAPVVQGWVKRTPDGAKILKAFRAEIKRYRASK